MKIIKKQLKYKGINGNSSTGVKQTATDSKNNKGQTMH